ncbi:hypothetical protein GCM10009802_13740 [Streptomyces synnematoformans]|uniref:LamG-like jellyroll fold domain-containing protein n=1 Tax=Streptomyces synnematoformans TaxID=415721 RepID=A0ABP5J9Y7_9ACTN
MPAQRSEYATVYANPDGFSFTLEESAVPVRVRTAGGDWTEPDPTLELRPDGTVAPRAAMAELAFSGGGAGAELVSVARQGRSLTLGWPGRLPEPRLEGATATYAEVLPGVDLQLTASVTGFRQVLVVKTREAAASQALERIDYGVRAKGLALRERAGGALAAVDADGRTVFAAPPAQMWDSAGAATAQQQAQDTGSVSTADDGSDAPNPGVEPAPGDAVTEMEVEVSEDALSVIPDAAMLSETDASAFPLYIDPTVTWGEAERTLLRSDGYKNYGWGNGSDDRGKGMGRCGTANGYTCGPGYRQRLYFEFSPSKLKGKKVLDATFRVTETWSFDCTARWVDLRRTKGISSSSKWPGPEAFDLLGDRKVSAGRGSLCDPSQPRKAIEFNDNPNESDENLTPTVRKFADGKFSRLTLMLRAKNESYTVAWKRFKNDAVLAVKYVGKPAKPSAVGLVSGSSQVCETNASDPQIVSDPTPALTATPRTKKGGGSGAKLRAYFDIDHKKADGSWADTPNDVGNLRPSSGFVGSGHRLVMSWGPALAEGKLYRYRAWTRSYYDNGTQYLAGPSNASTGGWCYFRVDKERPLAPQVTIADPYSECLPNACARGGGPGVAASFAFSPADGVTDTTGYQFRVTGQSSWSPKLSGETAQASYTPPKSGTYRVYARARDTVGWGETQVIDFLVDAGAGPVGRWHFDEASGMAIDSATADGVPRHDATLHGTATRDDRGRRGLLTHDGDGQPLPEWHEDRGLSLDGSGAHAATDGPVIETRSAYTVSAWARLNSTDRDGIVLSQDGNNYSPFILWYETSYDTWVFGVKEKDEDTGTAYYGVVADQPAASGTWTHLAGTYDPASDELKLYVNGKLQGTRTVPGSWNATGDFQFGRYLWAGNRYWDFNGSIDEAAVWQRVLTPEEVADEARLMTSDEIAGAELVADWDPSLDSGTTLQDRSSGYGRDMTLVGGATLDGEAIVLDGVDGAGTVPGPLVDDTGSFTVTAEAELDRDALVGKDVGYVGPVAGQRTGDGSAWGLWFELTGKKTGVDDEGVEVTVPLGVWHFGRLNNDNSFASVSSAAAEVDDLARITGVFDAQDSTVSLYLGLNPEGEPQAFTAKVGSGDFTVGRAYAGGSWGHYLPARLTDVRLFAGAMADDRQIQVRIGD